MSDLEAYAALGRSGPIESRIGEAIISLVEPHEGREREFNRWYEDDHMIVSAMGCPWVFAGRRWVATRALRDLRSPRQSSVANPVDLGCYLAAYWITAGRYNQFLAWVRALVAERLMPVGRMSPPRRHIFTNDQRYLGPAYRDPVGPRDIHALGYPFPGLVLQVIEAETAEARDALARWLLDVHLPNALKTSPAAMALVFHSLTPPSPKPGADWYDRRLTVMWFLDEEPTASWPTLFPPQEAEVAASGLGRVVFAGPFIPVLPGTDVYVEGLR